jgi:hypothetical protein
MPKAPSAVQRFAPPTPRDYPLSTNQSTIRSREYRQSQFGFDAEVHRIKIKYRTKLARAKDKMRKEPRWGKLSSNDQRRLKEELITCINQEKEKEFDQASLDWEKVIKGELILGIDGNIGQTIEIKAMDELESTENTDPEEWKGIEDVDEEYEEWTGIIEDEQLEKHDNKSDIKGSGWETEEDGDELELRKYLDEEGNPICIEDLTMDLRAVYDRHMGEIQKKLTVYEQLARLEPENK